MTRDVFVTACTDCPLRDFDVFKQRTQSEVSFIQRFKDGERSALAGTVILDEGTHNDSLFTVLSG